MANNQGSQNHNDKMSRQDAGRMGGEATAENHDSNFSSKIGKMGGDERAQDQDVKGGEFGKMGADARWGSDNSSNQSGGSQRGGNQGGRT